MSANIRVIFNYLKSDLIKKERTFKLGLITIYLVVFFVSIILNIIVLSPVIFIKVAENSTGENDIIITPKPNTIDIATKKSYVQLLRDTHRGSNEKSYFKQISEELNLENLNENLVNKTDFQLEALTSLIKGYSFDNLNLLNFNYIHKKLMYFNHIDSTSNYNEAITEYYKTYNITENDINIYNEYISNNTKIFSELSNNKWKLLNTINNTYLKNPILGVTPRWFLVGDVVLDNNKINTNLLVIDSKLENKYNFGRNIVLPNLEYLDCYVTESIINSLNLNKNQNNYIEVRLSIFKLLKTIQNKNLINKLDYDGYNNYSDDNEENNYSDNQLRESIDATSRFNNNNISNEYEVEDLYNPDIDSNLLPIRYKYNRRKIQDEILKISIPERLDLIDNRYIIKEQDSNIEEAEFIKNIIRSLGFLNNLQISSNLKDYINLLTKSNFYNNTNSVNLNDLNSLLNITLKDFSNNLKNISIDNNYNTKIINSILENGIENKTFIENFIIDNSNSTNTYSIENYDNKTKIIKLNKTNIEESLNTIDNNNFKINLNISNYLLNLPSSQLIDLFTIKLKLKIKEVLPNTNTGKWPSALGNIVVIDSRFVKEYLVDNAISFIINSVNKSSPILINFESFKSLLLNNSYVKNFDIYKYVLFVNVILKNKFNIYVQNQKNQIRSLSKITNKIINYLDLSFNGDIKLSLYEAYKSVSVIKSFLDNIFFQIIFFMIILSILLVYSLMIGNAEERTYEFGMLRALGFKKTNLVKLIFLQSLIFSVPAIIIGLYSAGSVNIIISFFLFEFYGLTISYFLNPISGIFTTIIGLLIPIFSCYAPITNVLKKSLKESLAIFNKKLTDISISIIKLEKLGISPAAFLCSLLMIIIGFGTYYLAPLSFLLNNITLFLIMMSTLILLMIIGLVLMAQLIVPTLQNIILNLLIYTIGYKDKNIKFIIQKNLIGHFKRNQKTTIMFMIALSFTIFSGISLRLISNFISNVAQSLSGADIYIVQESQYDTLPEINLKNYLDLFNKKHKNILKGYTFISYPSNQILNANSKLSTESGSPYFDTHLSGIQENIIKDSSYDLTLNVASYDKSLKFNMSPNNNYNPDIAEGLYLNYGYNKYSTKYNIYDEISSPIISFFHKKELKYTKDLLLIVSESYKKSYGLELNSPVKFIIDRGIERVYKGKIIAFASKFPSFNYSSYFKLLKSNPIVSNIQLKEIIDIEARYNPKLKAVLSSQSANYKTPDNLRKMYMLIKLNDLNNNDKKIKQLLITEIKNIINNEDTNLIDINSLVEEANSTGIVLEYLFILIGIIALILSYFLLWVSFNSNIRDNICEFGIIRSIGLTKSKSIKCYLYEAICLILTAIFIGTLIGLFVSTTLILQFNMFVELPFKLDFPILLYLTISIFAIILSLLGSYYPTYKATKTSLVKILKGLIE